MSKKKNFGHNNFRPKGLIISSPQGHSGKTTIAIGLSRLLLESGYQVQPFKKGPDYIDPSWLTIAAKRPCRNLDLFLMPKEKLIESFMKNCIGIDIAVVEGAMGLYDGLNTHETTAELSYLFNLPIILVITTDRMTESISAMVTGYQNFRKDISIGGVILNHVSGIRHEEKLRNAVERYCKIPVVGSIQTNMNLKIPERHLGLIPSEESEQAESVVNLIVKQLKPCIDLKTILEIANRSNNPKYYSKVLEGTSGLMQIKKKNFRGNQASKIKIGVIRDQVFSFYYPENLEELEEKGAELIFINSLKGRLPLIDGLYIGGGFPEFFLEKLENNISLREDIAKAIEEGLPVYAECAGLMYLCQKIHWKGQSYEMIGKIPAEVEISQKPEGHGYVVAKVDCENPIYPKGTIILGHEFHHSKLSLKKEVKFSFNIKRGHGIDGKKDGILYKNMFATYIHIHALGTPQWSKAFISLIKARRGRQ